MKFKQFSQWCNERACDGCWGLFEAVLCSRICENVSKIPFFRREKEWKKIDKELKIVENIVKPTNKKIEEILGANHDRK